MLTLFLEVAASGEKLSFQDTAITAVLGYAVVFAGLFALMGVLYLSGAIFKKLNARKAAAGQAEAAPAAPAVPETPAAAAPGSAGEVKRYSVSDKEAAMIMAIVADQLQKPVNELRFKSIKEVK